MFYASRLAVSVFSLVAVGGAGWEFHVADGLQSDFPAFQKYCGLYLCDDDDVVRHAYDLQIKGDPDSVSKAIVLLEGLLARDQAAALRWKDLSDGYAQADSMDRAAYCMDRALTLGHASADMLISGFSFFVRHGDRPKGLRCLAHILELVPEDYQLVFSYFPSRGIRLEDLTGGGLPVEKGPAQAYLRLLMRQPAPADARKLWDWMSAHHLTDAQLASDYSNFLLAQKLYREASAVHAGGAATAATLMHNGGFEDETTGAALDWTIVQQPHVQVSRDSPGYSGKYCARLSFDGTENTGYRHLSQKVIVQPGKYRLQAFVRSENLSTDRGVALRVMDPEVSSRLLVETEATRGTTPWHAVNATFTVSAATPLIEVAVVRNPSASADDKIKGTVWIDQVSIAPLP